MPDILLAYRASQSPGSILDAIYQQQEKDNEAYKSAANEYADFKEFLIDHYLEGGYEHFKEIYLKFMRWQGYNDKDVREIWPELLDQ